MTRWLNGMQPWGIFLVRIALGVAMMYHGWPKVIPAGGPFHHHPTAAIDHYAHFVASLGLPPWLGYVSALTEFVGGALLILGLFTRFSALLVAINMAFAIIFVDVHHGYVASEYSIALLSMAILLVLTGAGAVALDRKIGFI